MHEIEETGGGPGDEQVLSPGDGLDNDPSCIFRGKESAQTLDCPAYLRQRLCLVQVHGGVNLGRADDRELHPQWLQLVAQVVGQPKERGL